jgi:hypothetical protein
VICVDLQGAGFRPRPFAVSASGARIGLEFGFPIAPAVFIRLTDSRKSIQPIVNTNYRTDPTWTQAFYSALKQRYTETHLSQIEHGRQS